MTKIIILSNYMYSDYKSTLYTLFNNESTQVKVIHSSLNHGVHLLRIIELVVIEPGNHGQFFDMFVLDHNLSFAAGTADYLTLNERY